MAMWLRKMMRKQDGLTLIELIVVVAIIAILAFTITPRVLDALDNSKKNGARSVANELHSALERFYANEGATGVETYPITGAAADFDAVRTALADTLGLTNTTANVFAETVAGTPDFEYTPYEEQDATQAGATSSTVAAAEPALSYCVEFIARDRDTTHFLVTPEGVVETANGALGTCP